MGTSLVIGTRSLCAASFSAWLVLRRAGLRCNEIVVPLHQRDTARRLRELSPTGSVPCLVLDGVPITGPMGIADHAAWRLPTLWPDTEHRHLARQSALIAAHGLGDLAAFLPLDMGARFTPGPLIRPVVEGLARLTGIWDECRAASGSGSGFLFGRFGIVDAMMAPWASRLLTHAVPLEPRHAAYVAALQALPEWAEWAGAAKPGKAEAAPAPIAATWSWQPLEAMPPAEAEVVVEPEVVQPSVEAEVEVEAEVARAPVAAEVEPIEAMAVAEPAEESFEEPEQAVEPVVSRPAPAIRPAPAFGQLRATRRPGHVTPAAPAPRRRPIRPVPSAPPAPPPGGGSWQRARPAAALVAVAVVGTVAVLALPKALATIEHAVPYLRAVATMRTVSDASDTLGRIDPLPVALRAPEPTEAETAIHPRVVVHYSGAEAEAAQRLARQLIEKGYEVAVRPVNVPIARPSVRYFFADDRAATVELAASVGQSLNGRANPRVLDLTHYPSKPKPGTLEVWIGSARS